MRFKLFLALLVAIAVAACHHQGHDHDHDQDHDHDHDHEGLKVHYTAYTDLYELYAEADPFVAGESASLLVHLTLLPDFRPLDEARVTLRATIGGRVAGEIAEEPESPGIFHFHVDIPDSGGEGSLLFIVRSEHGDAEISISGITVYADDEAAEAEIEEQAHEVVNATTFTKEQSWKTDFATSLPVRGPFGQVIRTTALVQPVQGAESVVTARASGIVLFAGNTILEGTGVTAGQNLLTIAGAGFAEKSSNVRFTEAANNYEQARIDFERAQLLAADKIISEKQLIEARTQYENARAVYEDLRQNFSREGQVVRSPMSGFISHLHVRNGQYVDEGTPLLLVSSDRSLLLRAEVNQKYAGYLRSIATANIRVPGESRTYTLEELGGRLAATGRSTTPDNFLIPVTFRINNPGTLMPGSFVELYITTLTDTEALTVPNSALLEEEGMHFIFVQHTPELFERREIRTGPTDGIRTAVLSGLDDDERVVTRGAVMLKLARSTGALDPHAGHVH